MPTPSSKPVVRAIVTFVIALTLFQTVLVLLDVAWSDASVSIAAGAAAAAILALLEYRRSTATAP